MSGEHICLDGINVISVALMLWMRIATDPGGIRCCHVHTGTGIHMANSAQTTDALDCVRISLFSLVKVTCPFLGSESILVLEEAVDFYQMPIRLMSSSILLVH